eukprot:PhM_4_TR1407/c0_g1_i1/m.70335
MTLGVVVARVGNGGVPTELYQSTGVGDTNPSHTRRHQKHAREIRMIQERAQRLALRRELRRQLRLENAAKFNGDTLRESCKEAVCDAIKASAPGDPALDGETKSTSNSPKEQICSLPAVKPAMLAPKTARPSVVSLTFDVEARLEELRDFSKQYGATCGRRATQPNTGSPRQSTARKGPRDDDDDEGTLTHESTVSTLICSRTATEVVEPLMSTAVMTYRGRHVPRPPPARSIHHRVGYGPVVPPDDAVVCGHLEDPELAVGRPVDTKQLWQRVMAGTSEALAIAATIDSADLAEQEAQRMREVARVEAGRLEMEQRKRREEEEAQLALANALAQRRSSKYQNATQASKSKRPSRAVVNRMEEPRRGALWRTMCASLCGTCDVCKECLAALNERMQQYAEEDAVKAEALRERQLRKLAAKKKSPRPLSQRLLGPQVRASFSTLGNDVATLELGGSPMTINSEGYESSGASPMSSTALSSPLPSVLKKERKGNGNKSSVRGSGGSVVMSSSTMSNLRAKYTSKLRKVVATAGVEL